MLRGLGWASTLPDILFTPPLPRVEFEPTISRTHANLSGGHRVAALWPREFKSDIRGTCELSGESQAVSLWQCARGTFVSPHVCNF